MDKIFGEQKVSFNHKPSKLLVGAITDRDPGYAIDLGMGEGRNAIFLAREAGE